jgi:hypothetical protein
MMRRGKGPTGAGDGACVSEGVGKGVGDGAVDAEGVAGGLDGDGGLGPQAPTANTTATARPVSRRAGRRVGDIRRIRRRR